MMLGNKVVYSAYKEEFKYNGKVITIKIMDCGDFDGNEYTVLACEQFIGDPITLSNPTEQQVKHQIDNIVNIAREKIDSMPGIKQKIKKLFK